ncbi:MAG: uracil-DNA glycosylase [Spirochaetia bacterium]|nr:uracil-DNA glycosylase [Spirochaetia bacterium]
MPESDLFSFKEEESRRSTEEAERRKWDAERGQNMELLRTEAMSCVKCKLSRTRNKVVFGEGNERAEVMFIGEGPGRQEDATGRPFVGRAGELLTRIIENGMKVPRSHVYIANIVKCRPTVDLAMQKDRPPDLEETACCSPYLTRQIELIAPKAIIALGGPSTKFLLKTNEGITRLRGTWGSFNGIPVMPTYHPSYVLRQGGDKSPAKRDVWEDIKKVMEKVGWPIT